MSNESHDHRSLVVNLAPARLAVVLTVIVAVLTVLSIAAQIVRFYFNVPSAMRFVPKFYFDMEANVPTFYSSFLLLLAAVILGVIAWAKRRRHETAANHWLGLTVIFFFLAFDESAGIHELLIDPVRLLIGVNRYFYFAWIIPGSLLVGMLGVLYARWFMNLPARIRRGLLLAASLYLGGTLLFEILTGIYMYDHQAETLMYGLLVTIEELLEMLGVIVLIYNLLEYTKYYMKPIAVEVS